MKMEMIGKVESVFVFVWTLYLHVHMFVRMCVTIRGQKKVSGSLELESQINMSCHVGVGN